jgi:cytochrome b561
MKPWFAEGLFWAAIGFVACSFALGGIGVEISSGPQAELTLRWHKAFGLLSFLATLAAAIGFAYGKGGLSGPFRFWTLSFRTPISALLYVLLIAQPVSGWLLASLQGKLTTVFGLNLPALATSSGLLSEYVLTYHVLAAGLILIIAAWSLQLMWAAYFFGGVRKR